MQTTGKLFDDFAKMANSAAGAFSGVRHEIESAVKQRLERVLSDMDLVPREEFDAMAEVARRARLEQEKLEKRVSELESAMGVRPKKASAKKASPKTDGMKKTATSTGTKSRAKKTTAKKPN